MNHVMLDLETMGTSSQAAIVAIGAIEFDPVTGKLGREFYRNVDLSDCIKHGLRVDGRTVMWWLSQSDEARQALMATHPIPLRDALLQFDEFMQYVDVPSVWGNGAGFDNVILSNAYETVGLKRPWSYKGDRDVRTMTMLGEIIGIQHEDAAHNALEDAKIQARYVSQVWQKLLWDVEE